MVKRGQQLNDKVLQQEVHAEPRNGAANNLHPRNPSGTTLIFEPITTMSQNHQSLTLMSMRERQNCYWSLLCNKNINPYTSLVNRKISEPHNLVFPLAQLVFLLLFVGVSGHWVG